MSFLKKIQTNQLKVVAESLPEPFGILHFREFSAAANLAISDFMEFGSKDEKPFVYMQCAMIAQGLCDVDGNLELELTEECLAAIHNSLTLSQIEELYLIARRHSGNGAKDG